MNHLLQKLKVFWMAHSFRITLAISVIAGVVFFARGLFYVNHQAINMDEGTYLLKGKYYLEGTYEPYQIGGPVTNKGIFSFWILGLSQLIAPGVLSGRLFTLVLGTVMLAVLWLIVRRFSNQTWAAAILLLFSLNGYWISLYARALTQPVTSALTVFSVFFLTIKPVKSWHLTLGLLFGVIVSLTRQNLIPFYILSMAYVIWQFGIKRTWIPVAVSVAAFFAINVLFWPQIYNYMWRPLVRIVFEIADAVLPGQLLTPDPVAIEGYGQPAMSYDDFLVREPWNIFYGIGIYIMPVSIALSFLICGKWAKAVKQEQFKTFLFLYVSYVVLFVIHILAVLNDHVLIFSFPVYPSFFLPLGLLIIPWCIQWMDFKGNFTRALFISLMGVFMSTGIGLALHRTYSNRLMFLTVPRMRDMHFLPGTTELWRTLENKFYLGYNNIEYLLATVYGFMVGVFLIFFCYILFRILRKRSSKFSYVSIYLGLTLGLCAVFSPTTLLAGFPSTTVCQDSPIKSMEEVSSDLKELIPAGSLIYWEYHQPTLFLYLEDMRIFPLQLNNYFYKQVGGDTELLKKENLWNDEIARTWFRQADYLLLSENAAKIWEKRMNTDFYGLYDKIGETLNLDECIDRSFLHVYRNLDPID